MTVQNDMFDYSIEEGDNKYVILRRNDVLIAFMVPVCSSNPYALPPDFRVSIGGDAIFQHYKDQGFVETEIGRICSLENGAKCRVVSANSLSDAVRKAEHWRENRIKELEKELAVLGCQYPSLSIRPSPSAALQPAPDEHGSVG